MESRSGRCSRICWVLTGRSASGRTGSVSRVSHGSRSACWPSSSRLSQITPSTNACSCCGSWAGPSLRRRCGTTTTTARCCTWGWSWRKRKLWAPRRCLNPGLAVHLHLQQHHWLLRRAASPLCAAKRPHQGDGLRLLAPARQIDRAHRPAHRAQRGTAGRPPPATATRSDPARSGTARRTSDRFSKPSPPLNSHKAPASPPHPDHITVHLYCRASHPCSHGFPSQAPAAGMALAPPPPPGGHARAQPLHTTGLTEAPRPIA